MASKSKTVVGLDRFMGVDECFGPNGSKCNAYQRPPQQLCCYRHRPQYSTIHQVGEVNTQNSGIQGSGGNRAASLVVFQGIEPLEGVPFVGCKQCPDPKINPYRNMDYVESSMITHHFARKLENKILKLKNMDVLKTQKWPVTPLYISFF